MLRRNKINDGGHISRVEEERKDRCIGEEKIKKILHQAGFEDQLPNNLRACKKDDLTRLSVRKIKLPASAHSFELTPSILVDHSCCAIWQHLSACPLPSGTTIRAWGL